MENPTVINCPDVVIPNGTALSNIIPRSVTGDAYAIILLSPAVLDAHVFVIQVSDDPAATVNSNWFTLNNGTADVTPPAAGKASTYPFPAWSSWRIQDTSGNVAAARAWKLRKNA